MFKLQISISFAHNIGTRVRLSLMRSVSRRQKDKDPNAVCSVSSFTPRPMLRVGGGKDKGTRFLSFVDAMSGFRHLLTQEDIDKAASMCQGLKGHLSSRFIVISDDRTPPPPPNRKRPFNDDGEDVSGKQFQNEQSTAPGQTIPLHQFAAPMIYGPPVSQIVPSSGYFTAPVVPSAGYHQAPVGQIPQISAGYHQTSVGQTLQTSAGYYQAPVGQTLQTSHPLEIMHPAQTGQIMHATQAVTQAVVHHQPMPGNPAQSIFSPSAFPPLPDGQEMTLVGNQAAGSVDGFQTVRSSRRQSQRASGLVQGVSKIKHKRQTISDVRAASLNEEMDQDQVEGSQSDSSFADATELS